MDRFVKDTVKGGDFRGREADAYRLGAESVRVIDHMNAIGAPFAREYGGQLATRSFGGVQVSRTYYTRGQTGQQLQVAGANALLRQVAAGTVTLHTRQEMLDLIVADGRAQGIVVRDLVTGEIRAVTAHAVVLATGGYGNIYHKSTLAKNSNATAAWRAHRRGAHYANLCFIQFHPTALPLSSEWQSKTILMSESLRNDGRIWVPKQADDTRKPGGHPRGRAGLLPRAALPGVRQPDPPRRGLAGRPRAHRRRVRRGSVEELGVPGLLRTPSHALAATPSTPGTPTCSTCTSRPPATTRSRPRCGSPRARTSPWAGCGATTT